MPCRWPSFQVKRMAYLPTGSTSVGFARALNMGNWPAIGLIGSPGWRPSFPRSSLHSAHGHALRRNGKVYELRWPSFHSISMPVPEVTFTLTDFGSAVGNIGTLPAGLGLLTSIAEKACREGRRLR